MIFNIYDLNPNLDLQDFRKLNPNYRLEFYYIEKLFFTHFIIFGFISIIPIKYFSSLPHSPKLI